jgi:hypothetical protein
VPANGTLPTDPAAADGTSALSSFVGLLRKNVSTASGRLGDEAGSYWKPPLPGSVASKFGSQLGRSSNSFTEALAAKPPQLQRSSSSMARWAAAEGISASGNAAAAFDGAASSDDEVGTDV